MKLSSFVFLAFLALLSFTGCKEHYAPAHITGKEIPVTTQIKPDTAIQNFIKPYSQHINKTLDSVLAYNPTNLDKHAVKLNTALGNLMADIVYEQTNPVFNKRTGKNIDFVLLNYGGIRASVGKGPVNARTAYELMPFENEVVVAELSGKKVLEMLHYLENVKVANPVSGIKIKMDKNFKVIDAKVKGKDIDPDKNYYVATSDYLQQGGDSMNFFKDPVNLYGSDYKIRNEIIDYFKKVDTLKTKEDDRFIQVE